MGLSHPICSKVLWRWGNEYYMAGVATMQGPRKSLEDAHVLRLVGDLPVPGDNKESEILESKRDASLANQTMKAGNNNQAMLQTMMRSSIEPPDVLDDPTSKNTEGLLNTTMMDKTMAADTQNFVKANPKRPPPIDASASLVAGKGNHLQIPKSNPITSPRISKGVLPKSERINTPNHGGDESNRLLLGVFDGHGGDHVAKYLKNNIPAELDKIKDNLSKKVRIFVLLLM
jgi:hypothetical protein